MSDEHHTRANDPASERAAYYRRIRAACARGFRVRSPWLVVTGLIVAIVCGYVYFEVRTVPTVEGGFPSSMQDVDR
jgi:hypothetical protein